MLQSVRKWSFLVFEPERATVIVLNKQNKTMRNLYEPTEKQLEATDPLHVQL